MSNGTIEFYLTGTSTPTPFYTDSAGTSGGTSLTLDSGGKPSTDVFFDTAITYKLVVKNAAGGTVETLEPYDAGLQGGTVATVADLRLANMSLVSVVQTLGYYAAGDGGGAQYYADASDTSTADDGFLCIVSGNGVRFKLVDSGNINVKMAGAKGDWSGDSGAAIQLAYAGAQSLSTSWTNTDGENPTSGTLPPVQFPSGIYQSTLPLTNGIAYNFIKTQGAPSIISDTPLRTVSEAFRFGSDWSMDGIEVRGFQRCVVIDNNNVNQSHHWVTNCHFHKPSVAVFEFESNPQSGQLTIERCSVTTIDGSKLFYMPTDAERVDFIAIRDLWVQPELNDSNTFNIDGTLMDLKCSSALIENMTGVPTGTLDTSVAASWMRFYGTNLQINHCNFGPELTGGITALENFAEATESTDLKTQISMTNSRWGTSGSRPLVRFFKLPNTITLRAMNDDGVNGGIEYVDATDAAGVSESSGIDIDNLRAFAKDGAVFVDSWDYLVSRQSAMGPHAGLGYQLVKAAYYDQIGVPYTDKVKVTDIVGCTQHNQGTKVTGGSGTTGADTIDYRGVAVRTRTATEDGASYSLQWNSFIDYTLIGADVNSIDCAMTMLVEIEYTPAKQGSATFNPSIAENNKKYPLEAGSKTYAVPFVYFNTTNAADSFLDRLTINVGNMSSGDAVAFKRVMIVKGFKQTNIEQITAFQDVATSPADIANTYFDSVAGWVKGDRVLNHAAGSDRGFYICTTEQTGTTVWGQGAAIS
jgi:hypothetical protein